MNVSIYKTKMDVSNEVIEVMDRIKEHIADCTGSDGELFTEKLIEKIMADMAKDLEEFQRNI